MRNFKLDEYMKAIGYTTEMEISELVGEYIYFKEIGNIKKATSCAIMGLMKEYSKNRAVNKENIVQLHDFFEKFGKIIKTPIHGDKYLKYAYTNDFGQNSEEFQKAADYLCGKFEQDFSKEIYIFISVCDSDMGQFRKALKRIAKAESENKEKNKILLAIEKNKERQKVFQNREI